LTEGVSLSHHKYKLFSGGGKAAALRPHISDSGMNAHTAPFEPMLQHFLSNESWLIKIQVKQSLERQNLQPNTPKRKLQIWRKRKYLDEYIIQTSQLAQHRNNFHLASIGALKQNLRFRGRREKIFYYKAGPGMNSPNSVTARGKPKRRRARPFFEIFGAAPPRDVTLLHVQSVAAL
jgi:hypothetical protein